MLGKTTPMINYLDQKRMEVKDSDETRSGDRLRLIVKLWDA